MYSHNYKEEFSKDNLEIKLMNLQKKTGYAMKQINGERIFRLPLNYYGHPEPGSEIFIGRIPRDCFEDELVPLLMSVGRLYMLRLKMEFSGINRGFAFALYESPKTANMAVARLNNFPIRRGHPLGVSISLDNRKLVIYGLPVDSKVDDVLGVLKAHVCDFKNISFYQESFNSSCAIEVIVEFNSHFAAAQARKVLVPGSTRLWRSGVSVDWEDPTTYRNPYTCLYSVKM